MKRLLLLLPLLLTPAAQAIDYVKCEAMQKAAARVEASQKKAVQPYIQALKGPILEEECGKSPDYLEDPDSYDERRSVYDECTKPGGRAFTRIVAALEAVPEMVEMTARLEKIKADYEKEGCY